MHRETSRSFAERFKEHMKTIKSTNENVRKKSFLYEHIMEQHNGTLPPIKAEFIGRYPGDPGMRQAAEAVSIRQNKPQLNGKEEWTNERRSRREN